MSRWSRADGYLRIWLNFSNSPDSPIPEHRLVEFENRLRGFINRCGFEVTALEFKAKDGRVVPDQDKR